MNKIHKVALIGCGKRGRFSALAIKNDCRCKLVALVDIKQEAAQGINDEFGFDAPIYTSHLDMLENEKPDIVVACLWPKLRLPIFRDVANAGVKAVFAEKPMAPTWGESLEIAEIAEKTGCLLSFSHQRRFSAGNRYIRQLMKENRLGQIIRMDLFAKKHLLDCGTHSLDQAFSFIDETPVKWVMGCLESKNPFQWFDVPAEEIFTGTIMYENGILANIYLNCPGMDRVNPGGVTIYGTEGFIDTTWEGEILRGCIYNDATWQPPALDNKDEKAHTEVNVTRSFAHVVDCYENGVESDLSWQKTKRATEVIFALYESVRINSHVELPLTGITDNPYISMLESGRFNMKGELNHEKS